MSPPESTHVLDVDALRVLHAILADAGGLGLREISLETGSPDFFRPARRPYARHGFAEC